MERAWGRTVETLRDLFPSAAGWALRSDPPYNADELFGEIRLHRRLFTGLKVYVGLWGDGHDTGIKVEVCRQSVQLYAALELLGLLGTAFFLITLIGLCVVAATLENWWTLALAIPLTILFIWAITPVMNSFDALSMKLSQTFDWNKVTREELVRAVDAVFPIWERFVSDTDFGKTGNG